MSTIIVSVVGVGQEIVDEPGQEGPDQIHSPDLVDSILPGETLPVTAAHQNSHKRPRSRCGK